MISGLGNFLQKKGKRNNYHSSEFHERGKLLEDFPTRSSDPRSDGGLVPQLLEQKKKELTKVDGQLNSVLRFIGVATEHLEQGTANQEDAMLLKEAVKIVNEVIDDKGKIKFWKYFGYRVPPQIIERFRTLNGSLIFELTTEELFEHCGPELNFFQELEAVDSPSLVRLQAVNKFALEILLIVSTNLDSSNSYEVVRAIREKIRIKIYQSPLFVWRVPPGYLSVEHDYPHRLIIAGTEEYHFRIRDFVFALFPDLFNIPDLCEFYLASIMDSTDAEIRDWLIPEKALLKSKSLY